MSSKPRLTKQEKIYRHEFQARTIIARESAGFSQEQVAEHLNIKQGTYKQYESRKNSVLPHYYVIRFCQLTRTNVYWLFSGKGRPRSQADGEHEQQSAPFRSKSR